MLSTRGIVPPSVYPPLTQDNAPRREEEEEEEEDEGEEDTRQLGPVAGTRSGHSGIPDEHGLVAGAGSTAGAAEGEAIPESSGVAASETGTGVRDGQMRRHNGANDVGSARESDEDNNYLNFLYQRNPDLVEQENQKDERFDRRDDGDGRAKGMDEHDRAEGNWTERGHIREREEENDGGQGSPTPPAPLSVESSEKVNDVDRGMGDGDIDDEEMVDGGKKDEGGSRGEEDEGGGGDEEDEGGSRDEEVVDREKGNEEGVDMVDDSSEMGTVGAVQSMEVDSASDARPPNPKPKPRPWKKSKKKPRRKPKPKPEPEPEASEPDEGEPEESESDEGRLPDVKVYMELRESRFVEVYDFTGEMVCFLRSWNIILLFICIRPMYRKTCKM
jgi:hypothetical protein